MVQSLRQVCPEVLGVQPKNAQSECTSKGVCKTNTRDMVSAVSHLVPYVFTPVCEIFRLGRNDIAAIRVPYTVPAQTTELRKGHIECALLNNGVDFVF